MKSHSLFAASLVALAVFSLSAQRSIADIAMTAQEVGSDVVFSYSGSIDLSGLGTGETRTSRGAVYPVNSWVGFGPSDWADGTSYISTVTDPPEEGIGTGSFQKASTWSGHYFSINHSTVSVPLGYASGSRIAGSITFAGKNLASLGVDSSGAPYTWELINGQKVTLSVLDPVAGSSIVKKALKKQVKKLKKKIKSARKKKQVARLKKFKKKLKSLKKRLRAL